MTPFLYKLDEAGEPVACTDPIEWAIWFERSHESRVVANTELSSGVRVSTVFLGVDHNFSNGDPMLWETMTFGSEYDSVCARYQSKKDALVGHEMWVLVAKGEMTPIDARQLKASSSWLSQVGGSARKKKVRS